MSAREGFCGGSRARYLLLGSTFYLLVLGTLMVYSASSVADYLRFEDSFYHLKRHILFVGIGLLMMYAASKVDYRFLRKAAWPFLGVCIAALVAVLAIGSMRWGATRWLDLGFITVQPSEYAKLACLLVAALSLSQWRARVITARQLTIRLGGAFAAVSSLVLFQPDMGTTVMIVSTLYFVLVLGRVKASLLAAGTALGIGAAGLLMFVASYREDRVLAFLDPWADPLGDGYQAIQSMLAFGSGGITGMGVGMSRQKFSFLPAAHTDFVFSIVGEELGLLGSLSVVLAFGVFTYAGLKIAFACKDSFGRLVAGGMTATIVLQAIVNMSMVIGLMPITGKPLPLVSYGGTAITLTLLSIGVILSVSSFGAKSQRLSAKRPLIKEPTRASLDERRRNSGSHLPRIGTRAAAVRKRA
ncbi:MAG: putative lipid II flippase FtsW [Actinobacteria bacterium]|nr:putative lipid II flippase FtsW [Actinomycetota bacterium]